MFIVHKYGDGQVVENFAGITDVCLQQHGFGVRTAALFRAVILVDSLVPAMNEIFGRISAHGLRESGIVNGQVAVAVDG